MKNKRANILTENIIFIILNLVFIAILLTFIFTKAGTGAILEEKYAKEIALMIDSAEPGMILELNMLDASEEARKKNMDFSEGVKINENIVMVRLAPDSQGYTYSFFNDVEVDYDVFRQTDRTGYSFTINEKSIENGQ